YQGLYPGVDLVYYGTAQHQLEYDFVVAPGADAQAIRLGFSGADRLTVDAQGALVLDTPQGPVRQHRPLIYQEVGGKRQPVDGNYFVDGAQQVGFQLGAYDRGRPLVIDPTLSYSISFPTGNSLGIAVDAAGNTYLTGYT